MADTSSLTAPLCGGQEQPLDGVLPGNAAASVRSAGLADANPAAGEFADSISSTTPLRWPQRNQEASDDAQALQAAGDALWVDVDAAAAAEAAATGAARAAGDGGQAQHARRQAQAASAAVGGLAGQDWQLPAHLGGCSCCADAGDALEWWPGDDDGARRPLGAPTRSHALPAPLAAAELPAAAEDGSSGAGPLLCCAAEPDAAEGAVTTTGGAGGCEAAAGAVGALGQSATDGSTFVPAADGGAGGAEAASLAESGDDIEVAMGADALADLEADVVAREEAAAPCSQSSRPSTPGG